MATDAGTAAQPPIDLEACASEPIRIPGSIQPHGFLIALSAQDGRILQVSDNIHAVLGMPAQDVLGQPLEHALGADGAASIAAALEREGASERVHYLGTICLGGDKHHDVLAHAREGLIMLEFEPAQRATAGRADFSLLYPLLDKFLSGLTDAASVEAMSNLVCCEVKRATGFGRVLVYRFDHDGHGHVIAEARDEEFPSYLHQRFPESDIPRQARELYLVNRMRLIPNASYTPARLVPDCNPLTGAPTDLSFASLRSVSPVHLQYMRNMGTWASMSVSLIVKGRLWGLVSCHNTGARFVPFEIRAACEQLAQIFALRIESKEDSEEYDTRLELRRILVSMLANLTQGDDFCGNMDRVAPELLRFASASGAALLFEGRLERYGDTPGEEEIHQLVDWLAINTHADAFHTNALRTVYPEGEAIKRNASGVLALPISRLHRHYLIWFRPEVVHTIDWAGNPHLKSDSDGAAKPLSPRMSFRTWRETVHGASVPWRTSEIETALEFRSALLDIVLERAEAMAELAEELGRVNKELEAFSYSVSHDLRAPLRHIVGFSDLLLQFEGADAPERRVRFIRNIKESARFAGKLVDDLLSFSQMGRASLRPSVVDMNELVMSCREKLDMDIGDRNIQWEISTLPAIHADPNFLHLAVFNLLSNAVKYTMPKEHAVIGVSAEETDAEYQFHFRDNGVGFDMKYVHKLFGVFQRLHRMEDFPGTGIGLANVRRIVERHGGRVWAEGSIDEGATISFAIPRQPIFGQVS